MRAALLAVLFCNLTLLAADVTGTWSGTVKIKHDGGDQNDSAHLVLKQEGNTVSGSIGVHSDDLRPIANGKIEGERITFDVSTNNGSFKVSLKMQTGGETLAGDVRNDVNEAVAEIELKRQK